MMDIVDMETFTNLAGSTWDRLSANPHLRNEYGKEWARQWDELFRLLGKWGNLVEKESELFFRERKFLLYKDEEPVIGNMDVERKKLDVQRKELAKKIYELVQDMDIKEVFDGRADKEKSPEVEEPIQEKIFKDE